MRLGSRELLEIASVEGEEFTTEVAAPVAGVPDDEVSRWLNGALRRQRLVLPTGLRTVGVRRVSRHRFAHYVLRQYLYSRLDPIDRMRLHEAVGRRLESVYGEGATEVVAQLAWHFDQAGLAEKAIDYLAAAGQQAMRVSAYHEAIRHFERGLALLAALPATPERNGRELDLRLPLSSALIVTRGWASPERAAAVSDAALEMGESNATAQAVRLLIVRASVHQAQGQLAQSVEIPAAAERLAGAGQQHAVADPHLTVEMLHQPLLAPGEELGGLVAPGVEMLAIDHPPGDGELRGVVGELAVEPPFVGCLIFQGAGRMLGTQCVEVGR